MTLDSLLTLSTYMMKIFIDILCFLIYFSTCEGGIFSIEIKNLTDVRKCRVTHTGTEYTGPISKTVSGIRCQFWDTEYPTHEISEDIVDEMFPDGSKSLAKNWCRNPGEQRDEPWCYTVNKEIIDDFCDVPLCIYQECRLTGPGVEYAGKVKKSASEGECLSWKKRHKTRKSEKKNRFSNSAFPDGARKRAKRQCRNPDGDPGGPWCYVKQEEIQEENGEEDKDTVKKDYCEIPFCDEPDCMVYTAVGSSSESVVHSHWTSLNTTLRNVSIVMKLWQPEDWLHVKLHLALSVVPVPSSAAQLDMWQAGIEIVLSNNRSGLIAGGKEKKMTTTPNLITGTRWTTIQIGWDEGSIKMCQGTACAPIMNVEFNATDGLLGLEPGAFHYYSIIGGGGLWSFPFCDSDCEVHTTTKPVFIRFWPLKKTVTSHEATVFVRAKHFAFLELRVSPAIKYPSIRLILSGHGNLTQMILHHNNETKGITMKEVRAEELLSYWEWKEFAFSVFGNTFSVFWTRDVGTQILIEVEHEVIRSMRWISPASLTTAHWTLFCAPTESAMVPAALPPECSLSYKDLDYEGTQWITQTGKPCLPWIHQDPAMEFSKGSNFFQKNSLTEILNYCRNPTRDPNGPYCFVQDSLTKAVTKEYCNPRKCRATECRTAGTGNDYIGTLDKTRSNRTCQRWAANFPHQVLKKFKNDTLYADQSVEKAKNYCRNPSRSLAGSWCYTLDPAVPQDVCDVRDCVKPEECTMLTRGSGTGRLVYIHHKWRKHGLKFWLKEFDPDLPDGIAFIIRPLQGNNYYKLIIGAEDNEKVVLIYGKGGDQKEEVLKQKTLPHLIPIGKWGGFWLKVPAGRISLGYIGLDNYLFDWQHSKTDLPEKQKHEMFKPMFITYTSVKGNTIGISFPCDDCHTEKTSTARLTKILSLGLWSKNTGSHYNNLRLHIRGTGVAVLPLLKLPGEGKYYALTIGDHKNGIYFIWQSGNQVKLVTRARIEGLMILPDKWTVFDVSYNETNLLVKRNGAVILQWYQKESMLFYWFSLGSEKGELTWSINCDPVDLEGPPRNGSWSEWSPWTCSVSCGGGEGIQTRTCTNPAPNIYGEDCVGDDKLLGDCNTFKCGEISPDTVEFLRHILQRENQRLEVNEGNDVELKCNQEALKKILTEAPTANITWAQNGGRINTDSERVYINNYTNIEIRSAHPNDTGIYTCMAFQVSGARSIISVVSLAVKPLHPTVSVRATRDITLKCQGEVLSYIYMDLTQRWEVNGAIFKDYGITTLAAVNTEKIKHVNQSYNGEWKCIVSQQQLHFQWTTNWVLVEVKSPPNFLTYMMEDSLPSYIFGELKNEGYVLAVLIFILVMTVVIVAGVTYMILRFCRLPQRKK